MDLELLDKLMQIFDNSQSETLELEFNDTKIKLSKKAGLETTGNNQGTIIQIGQTSGAMSMPAAQPMVSAPVASAAPAVTSVASSAPEVVASNSHEIKSPIVGTFYRSPSPDSDPFVEVGSRVSIGQTLCIIEAMKLMNEIECDVNGVVEQVLLTNGTPVEYNQVLFKIKAD